MRKKLSTFVALLLALALPALAHSASFVTDTYEKVTSVTLQNAATGTGVGASIDTSGYSIVGVEVTISATATITFQGLVDTTWGATLCTPINGGAATTQAAATGQFRCILTGLKGFRANITSYGSGTVTAIAFATTGSASPGDTISSTGQGIPDATTQRVFVAQRATYTVATAAKTATSAGTGPFFALCGSSTKTLRVQRIIIGGTVATAAVNGDVELTKTSTATSAGTPVALTKLPHDSNSAASTASLANFYSALATAGTAVGKVGSQTAFLPIAPASGTAAVFDFSQRTESEAPVLRGTAQCIEASFGTTTTNAPTLTVEANYTEE
jgi:hypothetical protein